MPGLVRIFLRTLYKRGYEPISLDDIDTVFNPNKKEEIIAFGFPMESVVALHQYPLSFYTIRSQQISIPMVSTGFYLNDYGTSAFEGSIFVYHGFSGGPVVQNNKLIGIVSKGVFPRKEVLSTKKNLNSYLLSQTVFAKSTLILPLLKQLVSTGR